MGIALLTLADLFMPLQSLASRWMPARRAHRNAGLRYVAVRPACTVRPAAANVAPAARPLRVVRVLDGQRAGRASGRVVISGRMADVCAELDRLVALEAADDSRHLMH
ncbi:hypothetical protein QTH89_02235 [Variovorax sp. J22G21]|uniref:hypothetical protein n=1 Tax=Variovorax fucosicus TaxID=3053517 RepID=UPI002578E768|nr:MULTISPECIES: hypothetical protein [unclassified Variovorax]MDM0040956.1 hypothetical protein [Variovorax sp. J22R193]MDM0057327.1 hypothetical protein [Variovorax sp. J22G47]MDM0060013.1 hypothetical protein [Variovorax sp. J22G21]